MKKVFLITLFCLLPMFARAETVTLTPTADATIWQTHPNTNFGTGTLAVSGPIGTQQALIKFDLGDRIPVGSTLNYAYLKVNLLNRICNEMKFWTYRLTSSWTEMSTTYATAPRRTLDNAASTTLRSTDTVPRYLSWNITNIVRGWINGSYNNYGVQISYDVYDDCNVHFSSREWEEKPQLVLDYTPPVDRTAPQISNVWAQVEQEHVWVRWKTSNEDSNSNVKFKKVSDRSWSQGGADEMTKNHAVYLSALAPATTYQYKTLSVDWTGNSSESAIYEFTTLAANSGAANSTPTPSSSSSNSGSSAQTQSVYNIIDDVLGPTSARVKWWSSLPGTSWLFVSASADDNTPISAYTPIGYNDEETVHELTAENLTPATTYSYRVMTRSTNNLVAISDRLTFTTNARGVDGNEQNQSNNTSNASTEESAQNSGSGASNGTGETEAAINEAAAALGEEGQSQTSVPTSSIGNDESGNEAKKVESPEKANKWEMLLFVGSRLLFPLLFLVFVLIMIFIFWKRKKKDKKDKALIQEKSESVNSNTVSVSDTKTEGSKKSGLLKIVIIIIACLILVKVLIGGLSFLATLG